MKVHVTEIDQLLVPLTTYFKKDNFTHQEVIPILRFDFNFSIRNRIHSHYLLECLYARCGFASVIQLYEDYPSRYNFDIGRRISVSMVTGK